MPIVNIGLTSIGSNNATHARLNFDEFLSVFQTIPGVVVLGVTDITNGRRVNYLYKNSLYPGRIDFVFTSTTNTNIISYVLKKDGSATLESKTTGYNTTAVRTIKLFYSITCFMFTVENIYVCAYLLFSDGVFYPAGNTINRYPDPGVDNMACTMQKPFFTVQAENDNLILNMCRLYSSTEQGITDLLPVRVFSVLAAPFVNNKLYTDHLGREFIYTDNLIIY